MQPNNRLEFARVARPTRKGEAPLLAAQPESWASIMMRTTRITVVLFLGWVHAAYSADAPKSPHVLVDLEVEVSLPKLKYKIAIGPGRQMTFRYEYLDGAGGFSGLVSGSGFVDGGALRSIEGALADQDFFNLPSRLSYGSAEQGAGSYRLQVERDGKSHEVQMLEGGKKTEAEWVRFFMVWEKVIDMCPAQPRMPVPVTVAQSQPNKPLHATALRNAARER